MEYKFIDKELGNILIVRNIRAKKIIVRRKENYFQVTVPQRCSIKTIESTLLEMKPRLLQLAPQAPKIFFDEKTKLDTLSFSVTVLKSNIQNYYVSLKNGILQIVCPSSVIFSDERVQEKIRLLIEKVLCNEAKRILPDKVKKYADKFGFSYSVVKVNKSRTRWGSCSSKRNINLSCFCMFLPEYLIDFVILHELCHTIELNHGKSFWDLLDKITDNKAQLYTRSLKEQKIDW